MACVQLLLLTLALSGAALAMPQSSVDTLSDDQLLATLLEGGGGGGSAEQHAQPAAPVDEPVASDAELLAELGIGANGGQVVRCQQQQYVCVPYYQCREDEIITDGAGLIDIRFGQNQFNNGTPDATLTHSECPNFIDVCCRDPQAKIIEPTPEPYVPQCGRRNEFGINARITGFKEGETQFGEFPWMTAVLRVEEVGGEQKNLFVCGGALIHPQVVMTAAHCVGKYDAGELRVRLGEWDTQDTKEFYPHVDVAVATVNSHPEFNGRNLHNDIALLFLTEPVQLQDHIDTLCLPDPNTDYTNADCIATGWGKDRFDSGQYQTVLKSVGLVRVAHDYCQQQLRTTRLGTRFVLDDSFTCAGAPPQPLDQTLVRDVTADQKVADTCTGDGGSPLACRDPNNFNRYVHGGIVAWGIGCGEKGIPGVYADPQHFVYWIDEQVTNYFQLPQPYFSYLHQANQP